MFTNIDMQANIIIQNLCSNKYITYVLYTNSKTELWRLTSAMRSKLDNDICLSVWSLHVQHVRKTSLC